MSIDRIHIITLGVKDISRSMRFYRDVLGFKTAIQDENPQIVFFQNDGTTLALCPWEEVAKDINEGNPPQGNGFGGMTLAYICTSEEEVDEVMKKVKAGGGKIEKRPVRVFWGGYSGYFSDPDGYFWEVMFWEKWRFKPDGSLKID
ncbi:MAG: VOC family protein [Spirochaetales bacterium]|nr:VOC family protein [Spirochaetales bacterium]